MTSKIYLNQAIYLKKNVSQKNALLKRLVAYPSPSAVLLEELDPFDEFIATLSAAVVQTRRQFAADFFPILQKYHAFIIPTSETPNLIYHADYDSISATDWLKTLKEQRSKDIEKGYSNKGTHRDDLKFYIKGSPIKMIGSQGQRKTYLLALKFAEYEFVAQQTGKKPILLLDDIFEKLDEERLTRIAQLVSQDWSGQVFITDTNYTRIKNIFRYTNPELISYFSVENGELSKIE